MKTQSPSINPRKIVAATAAFFLLSAAGPSFLLSVIFIIVATALFLTLANAAPTVKPAAPISLQKLEFLYAQLKEQNVKYGYGSKAGDYSPDGTLARANVAKISKIDCSGMVRFGAYVASADTLIIPDGSQVQLDWAAKNLKRASSYENAARYMNKKRLFIAFIKPYTNGCGSVGHVWFLRERHDKPMTVESHGGVGVNSRAWDVRTLKNQVYAVYEMKATK